MGDAQSDARNVGRILVSVLNPLALGNAGSRLWSTPGPGQAMPAARQRLPDGDQSSDRSARILPAGGARPINRSLRPDLKGCPSPSTSISCSFTFGTLTRCRVSRGMLNAYLAYISVCDISMGDLVPVTSVES